MTTQTLRVVAFLALSATAACARAPAPRAATPAVAPPSIDSIVLERTRCYGTCPAYRLRIDRQAAVLLEPRNFGGDSVFRETVPPPVVDSLQVLLERSGFWTLPDSMEGTALCPDRATDHPTIIISVFGRPAKRIRYYTGCFLRSDHTTAPALLALRRFAAQMDSLTGAYRHIRSAPRR
jgi:hypothetical protein